MDIREEFLNEPRLSTFNKLCDHVIKGYDTYCSIIASTYMTTILSKYPDLVWLTPYNFNPIKRDALYYFMNGYYTEECWNVFYEVFEKLRDKKLIID